MEYVLSTHALDRFQERVHPTLTRTAAADLCQQLVGDHAWRQDRAPEWVYQSEVVEHDNVGWVCLGEDIVFPVSPAGVLKTCITRACMAKAVRAHRNRRNADARARKHYRGSSRVKSNRRPVVAA